MIAVAEEVAKGFWVIEAYHVGIIPPVSSIGGVIIIVIVPWTPRSVPHREGLQGVRRDC